MEKKTEVRTFSVSFICDECGDGSLVYSPDEVGIRYSGAQKYKHRCSKCDCLKFLDKTYPHIEYIPVA